MLKFLLVILTLEVFVDFSIIFPTSRKYEFSLLELFQMSQSQEEKLNLSTIGNSDEKHQEELVCLNNHADITKEFNSQ